MNLSILHMGNKKAPSTQSLILCSDNCSCFVGWLYVQRSSLCVPNDDRCPRRTFLIVGLVGPEAPQAAAHYPTVNSVSIRSTECGVLISIGTCMVASRILVQPHPVPLLVALPCDRCHVRGRQDHGQNC